MVRKQLIVTHRRMDLNVWFFACKPGVRSCREAEGRDIKWRAEPAQHLVVCGSDPADIFTRVTPERP